LERSHTWYRIKVQGKVRSGPSVAKKLGHGRVGKTIVPRSKHNRLNVARQHTKRKRKANRLRGGDSSDRPRKGKKPDGRISRERRYVRWMRKEMWLINHRRLKGKGSLTALTIVGENATWCLMTSRRHKVLLEGREISKPG